MPTGDRHTQVAAGAAFVGVPAILATIWATRTDPPGPGCGGVTSPAHDALVGGWLAGAGPIVATGAIAVLAAIVAVSRLRSAPNGWPRHVGARTAWAAGLLATYSVACAIDRDLFAVAGVTWGIVFLYFWPVTVPVVALGTAVWLAKRPVNVRGLAALQALGWWSLLVGVVGIAVAIALRDTAPLCLD